MGWGLEGVNDVFVGIEGGKEDKGYVGGMNVIVEFVGELMRGDLGDDDVGDNEVGEIVVEDRKG